MLALSKFIKEADTLFISFAPLRAKGKYLFYKARQLDNLDSLFFNDESDSFYLDLEEEVAEKINKQCASHTYKKIVIAGFSAGAFTACHITKRLTFDGMIAIHAFSPHINLDAPFSTAFNLFNGKRDIKAYSLGPILAEAPSTHEFNLYFSTTSARDGIHVRDSFNLSKSRTKIHYLKMGHDTHNIVRGENYLVLLKKLIDGTFSVNADLSTEAEQIIKCLMLTDLALHEMSNTQSQFTNPYLCPRDYGSEFCYWHSRQLSRKTLIADAITWGWAAIMKSGQPVPDSFPETLGHIAFDNGYYSEAHKAYSMIDQPNEEISGRLALMNTWINKNA